MYTQPSGHVRRAFTLIELLVVIAIIAILAAILFPVFATVREQARQSSTMSNMHSIYLGARLYYEDEGRYPPALFGYAETPLNASKPTDPPGEPALGATGNPPTTDPVTPMDKATEDFYSNGSLTRGYLYHEQVKDFVTFLCADNPVKNKQQVTQVYFPLALTQTLYGPKSPAQLVTWNTSASGQTPNPANCPYTGDIDLPCRQQGSGPYTYDCNAYVTTPKLYYVMDSMDIGPMLDPATGSQVKDSNGNPLYELHYSPDWTHELYNATNACDTYQGVLGVPNGTPITAQLKYKNPPTENTIITWNTQHAATTGTPNVIILLLSGTARKISYKQALQQLPLLYK